MNEYHYEYSNQKFLWILFGLVFGTFSAEFVIFIFLPNDNVSSILGLWFLIGIPILIFILLKKRIKEFGLVRLYNDSLDFRLSNIERKINFKDIECYYFYKDRNGSTTFTLYLSDKSELKIVSHSYYCNAALLSNFFVHFKDNIVAYNSENNCSISQLETIFAKKIIPYILIPATIVLIPLLYYIPFPPKIFIIGLTSGLIIPWIKYVNSRLKR